MDDLDRIKKLHSPGGFESLFMDEINQSETYKSVFERLNDEHEDFYGEPKYSGYGSFATCRWKKNRKY